MAGLTGGRLEAQRLGGDIGGGERAPAISGGRRWGRRRGRRCRAPAVERAGVDDAGDDGGSSGLIDRARGGRWPRWLRATSAAALGHGGEAEERVGGGPESEGEVRGGRRGAWRHRGVEEERGRLGGRSWRLRARWCRHASAYWQRWKKTKAPLVGWADSAGPPGEWASGKRQVSPSLSLFYLF